jgi:prepilin-type N-terminal cleavage/methylation domain-containing protein
MSIHNSKGFTIVELLIVIVVIGILAAITIVAFNSVQNKARTAAISADLSGAARILAAHEAQEGSFPTTLAEANNGTGVRASEGTSYQYASTGTTYCLTATKGTTSYKVSNDALTPAQGGCAGHGVGGVAAITNLVRNPVVATGTSDWVTTASTGGTSTGSRLTAQAPPVSGVTTAYRISLSGTPSSWWRVQNDSAIPVTEGQPYTLSGWIRPSVATTTYAIIIWRNSGGTTISESPSPATAHAANTWERRTITATAPVGAVSVRLQLGAPGGGVIGATLDGTAMMFVNSSTVHNFADGNTSNWIWNGTPNLSSSTGPPV